MSSPLPSTSAPGSSSTPRQPIKASAVEDLRPRHIAIADFIVAHPEVKLGDVALLFGCSQAWLSTLLRADLMRERIRGRQDQVFSEAQVEMQDRIDALARVSMDRILEMIPLSNDIGDVAKAVELSLKATGHIGAARAPTTGVVVQNYVSVGRDTLEQARAKARERFHVQGAVAGTAQQYELEGPKALPSEQYQVSGTDLDTDRAQPEGCVLEPEGRAQPEGVTFRTDASALPPVELSSSQPPEHTVLQETQPHVQSPQPPAR